ncbi:MAG: hypothetical protein HC809_10660 [Gammaproteobacteria bacterium]|nr:hypothetical protein [Gammaproteobacteria bacterium]
MTYLAILICAFVITGLALVAAQRAQVLAVPDHRSSHVRPTPSLGGLGIVVPSLIWAYLNLDHLPIASAVLSSGLAVAMVGLIDDIVGLSARVRWPVHVLAAAWQCGCCHPRH